ncbi:hypothetical protein ACFY05_04020 [Microtetraspora fusca]|uniref:Integral membrane protein n=1 Tax=Microtetraspora fusca TaxID=1997 RepID=A0ABW6UYU9_MICFU
MVTAADSVATPARSEAAHRTTLAGWILRAVVSAHVVAIVGQPVFAGVYLSGDYDSLGWHAAGANAVTSIGYLQVIAAIIVWIRLRQVWPFVTTLGVVAAETVQYFAGLAGALWLHIPLGVMTIVALVVQFIDVWRRPLQRRPHPSQERVPTAEQPERKEADDA